MRNKNAKVPDISKIFTNPGDRMVPIYKPRYNENGVIECVIDGYEDQQEKINAWRDQTDMAYIIHQLKMGNMDVLNQREGSYEDLTGLPDNFIDAMNILIEREQAFDALPADVKSKFDNNFRYWISSFGAPEWNEKMGIASPDPEEVKEVIEDAGT